MASPLAINPSTLAIIGILLVLVGFALAFLGRKLWTPFMSLVGAILGGTVGYLIGGFYASSGYVVALVLSMIGAVLGSILFNYLIKIALALIAAAIPAILAYRAMNPNPVLDQSAQDTAVIVAILVLLVVFAVAYYFVEELIGIVTSLVGGFLLGAGVFLAMNDGGLAIGSGAIVFVVGGLVQTLAIRTAKRRGAWRIHATQTPPVPPPPPPEPSAAPPTPPAAPPPPPPPP
ncbi:MAG: hypothetical protein HY557_02660 [Euryarchaeota archaeon]|nr:hypothetical protein [Euryarchaeota archaeon]